MIFDRLFKTKKRKVTVCHYTVKFVTYDNGIKATHKYTYSSYCNPDAISCSFIDYYLSGKNYLMDDDGVRYPMSAIHSVWAEVDGLIKVDYKDNMGYPQFWYPKEDLKDGEVLPV